ncbi:iron chelate uptake ABC transporter family permease subunit [Pelistega suis]|uniref:iron chelate uptake ABC transporter family permease subunit n=1 Tax=Pelistega suis TaxID=1631957 RepID=UPI00211BD7A3|nr:iron chelate uptake ABC transporter family permease subunit [Pelistega suis]MCQ9329509.1 iron chelate uptake ABC transporter family permease subunit [Pelistega suis]
MQKNKLWVLGLSLVVSMILFMTLNANGQWDFVLPFRGEKLVALLAVAYAISVSTILFQTLTANQILTPYIMGFDTLYLLIQTCLVFVLGGAAYAGLGGYIKFSIEVVCMLIAAILLFSSLFMKSQTDLYRLILTGVILGVLFRSANGFLQRIIDPEEFSVVQSASFAQFNIIKTALLYPSLVSILLVSVIIWRFRHVLDVLSLGKEQAINLGIDYRKTIMLILFLIAVLVSVSTALVGPVTFFGLLVSGMTYTIFRTYQHSILIPAAFLIGATNLILGQVIFEHLIGFKGVLSVVIEFIGGIVFIMFLLKRRAL